MLRESIREQWRFSVVPATFGRMLQLQLSCLRLVHFEDYAVQFFFQQAALYRNTLQSERKDLKSRMVAAGSKLRDS